MVAWELREVLVPDCASGHCVRLIFISTGRPENSKFNPDALSSWPPFHTHLLGGFSWPPKELFLVVDGPVVVKA